MTALPFNNLELDFGVSLLDAEYDDYFTLDPNNISAGVQDLSGNKMIGAPEVTINFSAKYTAEIYDWGNLTLRSDYYYSDDVFFTQFENPKAMQGAYSVVNALISFEAMDKSWRSSLYGKNLNNETIFSNVFVGAGLYGEVAILEPPRTYGIEFEFYF